MLQDLTYRMVVFDDSRDFYEDYVEIAEEILHKNGYLLEHKRFEELEELDSNSFDDVDLFLVDLNFGPSDEDDKGPEFIAKIREKYVTDILFYSSYQDRIRKCRKEGGYEGVFFAHREENKKEIKRKIEELIMEMIKRSNTPLASRGLVLGCVAELDGVIKQKIRLLFDKIPPDQVKGIMDDCTRSYHKSFKGRSNDIEKFFGIEFHKGNLKWNEVKNNYKEYDISELLNNTSITDTNKSFHILLKVYEKVMGKDETYKVISKFDNLLDDRNTLAHVKGERNEKGVYQFKKKKKDAYLTLSDRKCKELRKSIIKYYEIISEILS